MKVDYADALSKGIAFCIHPTRWVPFFLLDMAAFSLLLTVFMPNMAYFLYSMSAVEYNPLLLAPAVTAFFQIVIIFAAWVLANLWIQGAVIHQSYKEKEFSKSWGISLRRYPSILVATAITAITGFIVALVPYAGWIFSLIVSLAFFFILQSVIVKGSGFVRALEDSLELFRGNPFKVFLAWLTIAIIAGLIMVAFSIPMLALVFRTTMETTAGAEVTTATLFAILDSFQTNLTQFFISGIVLLVGFALSRTFAMKAQTEFYIQMKKAR